MRPDDLADPPGEWPDGLPTGRACIKSRRIQRMNRDCKDTVEPMLERQTDVKFDTSVLVTGR